ncbi:glycosyltransferase family 4 protein [bacterium]|nr:glycosyltransferase family 4 protein [bacterium]
MSVSDKPKVLVDLSLAILENSGIPLDTKWLFRQLATSKKIDLSGLIYSIDRQNIDFSLKNGVDRHKLLRYSQYIALLSSFDEETNQLLSKVFPLRLLKRLRHIYKIYFKRTFKLWEKESPMFNDAIFNIFFESGLASSDRDLILQSKFYFTDFFKHALMTRVNSPFPAMLPKVDTRGFDIVIHQDSTPVELSKGTLKVIRYHDPIPLTSPDMFKNPHGNATLHYKSVSLCAKQGAVYVCNSGPVEEELLELFPQLEGRTTTIPYTISPIYDKKVKDYQTLFDILEMRQSPKFEKTHPMWSSYFNKMRKTPKKFRYIAEVATVEPRKNHLRALRAFTIAKSRLKKKGIDLKFVIVGGLGWKYDRILKELQPLITRGDVVLMENMHPRELKYLFSHADAFLFPTLKEGFGLPPVEAMLCETPVISSDIKVHRWVQGEAAHYVNPYDFEDIADKIEYVVANKSKKDVQDKIAKGKVRARRYSSSENEKRWDEFFDDYKAGRYDKPLN